ncbi:meiosis-specific protein MEI4 [Sphaerodactylus townsendi]|uniref:meiosis-specific protein MEI4 n=1 Tax=Sphaerodactylus townsendi TaxID=933632 RepID=UPI0020270AFF|nr:meiosis-specific protein MEI4 [Sphaerodactylus townsendi]
MLDIIYLDFSTAFDKVVCDILIDSLVKCDLDPITVRWIEIKDRVDVTWYLKTSQLALALAVIRSKPPDQSSKEYTEHLAKIVSGLDSKWKSKAEALEAEVLRLRQQLSQLSSGLCLENRNSTVIGATVLSTNSEDCADHFEDSGCDVSSICIPDTVETLPTSTPSECGSNSCTSVVLSSVHPLLPPCHAFGTDYLVAHMQFLQRFLEVKKLTDTGGLRTDLKNLGIDCSKISDSLSQLVDGLVASYSLPELPFSVFLKQTIFVITKLLNDADLSRQIVAKCFRQLEESIKRLVAIVLNNTNLNRFQVQDSISHALVSLGKCSPLRNSTISLLFREVNRFAHELQHTNEVQAKYAIQYENIFFLCRVLEQLLQRGTGQENAASSVSDEDEKNKFLKNLDQIIFHLSDEFPLFCIYLWRLGTLLNAAQIQTDGERNWPASE